MLNTIFRIPYNTCSYIWLHTEYIQPPKTDKPRATYRLHTGYIQNTYSYIQAFSCLEITYSKDCIHILHTATYSYTQIIYRVHTDYTQITYNVHTVHTAYIQLHTDYIQFIYKLHTNYIQNTYRLHIIHTIYIHLHSKYI